jgi:hypothetical protein
MINADPIAFVVSTMGSKQIAPILQIVVCRAVGLARTHDNCTPILKKAHGTRHGVIMNIL